MQNSHNDGMEWFFSYKSQEVVKNDDRLRLEGAWQKEKKFIWNAMRKVDLENVIPAEHIVE